MAKYTITYSCGHEGTENLFGKNSERERRIAWLESSGVCSACYAERKRKEREAASVAAARTATSAGLPALAGTEKQVEWAERLRGEFCRSVVSDAEHLAETAKKENILPEMFASLAENPLDPANWAATADALAESGARPAEETSEFQSQAAAIASILRQSEARFWIDHRDHHPASLLELVMEAPKKLAAEAERRKREQETAETQAAEEAEKVRLAWAKKEAIAQTVHRLLNGADEPVYFLVCQPGVGGNRGERKRFESRPEADAFIYTLCVQDRSRASVLKQGGPKRIASQIEVWDKGDRRVFIGHGYDAHCATYYHTGNGKRKPGSLELTDAAREALGDRKEELRAFLAQLCGEWKSLTVHIAEDGSAANER